MRTPLVKSTRSPGLPCTRLTSARTSRSGDAILRRRGSPCVRLFHAYDGRVIREQLLSPSALDLTAFLLRHTRTRDCLVQVVGLAEVSYHGRAASTADVGAYLVLLKRDGSVQIHAPKGVKPMYGQPRTDEITARIENDHAVLLASRCSPTELVRVVFLEPHLAQALELTEAAGFVLSGSEAQMQEMLARQPELIEPGLKVLDRELLVESGGTDL